MKRFPYLQALHDVLPADALVIATSYTGREWNYLRPGDGNMRTRTLGLISSLAFGVALELPNRCVVALDGDGAFLMNLCGLPTIARHRPRNLIHVLFDNECYEASGAQPSASTVADLVAVARAAGYPRATWVDTPAAMADEAKRALKNRELTLIGAKIELGGADVPDFHMLEVEQKFRFIRHIEQTEKRSILSVWGVKPDSKPK
jgi:thiamine pyrophosphate-dependent acetolactate synthase large subunit-like protein